ncbi:MAG: hypothetical protein EXR67_05000 [Dehalococcoidia bacterium]|nr:hypothetical protein [Dehalococcoidia bacterium]
MQRATKSGGLGRSQRGGVKLIILFVFLGLVVLFVGVLASAGLIILGIFLWFSATIGVGTLLWGYGSSRARRPPSSAKAPDGARLVS